MTSLIELEPAVWSEKQFGACDLGDVRRTQRLVRYAQQMAEKPDASTPHQTTASSSAVGMFDRLASLCLMVSTDFLSLDVFLLAFLAMSH